MNEIKAKLDQSAAQLTAANAPWEMVPASFNGVEYRVYKNAPATLQDLLNGSRAHGEKVFLVYEDERITFQEFFRRADGIAWQLVNQLKVAPGDRVAIAMRNYPEWMISFVAVILAGGVAVPLNSWGHKPELEYGLKDSGAKLMIADQQRFDYIADDLDALGVTAIVARPEKPVTHPRAHDFDGLIKAAGENRLPPVTVSPDDVAIILYTSGTTGNPKGAVSNHRNVCQAIYNFEFAGNCAAMADLEPVMKMLGRGFEPKVLLSVPLFHVSGSHSIFLLSLRSGRPIVIMYKWDKIKALELVEKERVTMIGAVPTMLMDLLEAPEWNRYDTSSLFAFGAGGSAQPPRLYGLICEKLPDSFPGTGYGMTETNGTGFSSTGAPFRYKPRSAGVASPLIDVKIVDDAGNELPQGKPGEIRIKSPTNILGYWNKPEATKQALENGWIITGDIGYLDEEGFLFITDRIKDMIIRGGENIYSAEIEGAILTHEGIQEVAAFGLPDEKLGEELAVAVVAKPGYSFTAGEIQQHVATHLAKFKVPSYVFFEEALPRNAALKVVKKTLKEKHLPR
jgi:long-chain acyl-CoA synthetase